MVFFRVSSFPLGMEMEDPFSFRHSNWIVFGGGRKSIHYMLELIRGFKFGNAFFQFFKSSMRSHCLSFSSPF